MIISYLNYITAAAAIICAIAGVIWAVFAKCKADRRSSIIPVFGGLSGAVVNFVQGSSPCYATMYDIACGLVELMSFCAIIFLIQSRLVNDEDFRKWAGLN